MLVTGIEIVDAAGRALPAGREGIVRIASEFAVDRYLGDPIQSAQVFRDGYFYPGDLGALTADNILIISGRQNEVLNAGGEKIAPEPVEAALLSFPGVSQAAAFTAGGEISVDEVWAAVVCADTIDIERLRAHCQSRLPSSFVPARIAVIEALPVNAAGKVDRRRLRQVLAARSAP